MLQRIGVAVGAAVMMVGLGGGVATATPAGQAVKPAAAPMCQPVTWQDPPTSFAKNLHVRVNNCGNLAGRQAKIGLTNNHETKCRPLDGTNHVVWSVPTWANYANLKWC